MNRFKIKFRTKEKNVNSFYHNKIKANLKLSYYSRQIITFVAMQQTFKKQEKLKKSKLIEELFTQGKSLTVFPIKVDLFGNRS